MFRTTGRALLGATVSGVVLVVGLAGPAAARSTTVKVTIDDQRQDPKLAAELDTKFAAVYTALQPYRTGDTTYVAYTDLTTADTKAFSQATDSRAEPLSKVSKEVVRS